jgi:hypothetical protein
MATGDRARADSIMGGISFNQQQADVGLRRKRGDRTFDFNLVADRRSDGRYLKMAAAAGRCLRILVKRVMASLSSSSRLPPNNAK